MTAGESIRISVEGYIAGIKFMIIDATSVSGYFTCSLSPVTVMNTVHMEVIQPWLEIDLAT